MKRRYGLGNPGPTPALRLNFGLHSWCRPRRNQHGEATTEEEKPNFTTKDAKSTKLKRTESETFVAFVFFVV